MAERAIQRRDPERTRARILEAAKAEFAERGLGGARVDRIARLAGANKRMLYHYFGAKQELFLAVLEDTYEEIRSAEAALHLQELDPATAMRRLVEFSFDYFVDHPHFTRLLNSENLHRAAHLKRSQRLPAMQSPLIATITLVLQRGVDTGQFRDGVDPVQLYVSIAALGYFYFSNIHTLSAAFGKDLASRRHRLTRRQHVVDVILGYLRPQSP
jgi:AcrR family transcriptional regulator